MASLNELINLAQFQETMSQQADPLSIIGNIVKSVASQYIERKRNEAKVSRLKDIIAKGGQYKAKYTIDENGNLRMTFEPKEKKKKQFKTYQEEVYDERGITPVSYRYVIIDPETGEKRTIEEAGAKNQQAMKEPSVKPKKEKPVTSWRDLPVFNRILAGITPWATPYEHKLGALRLGREPILFNPPERGAPLINPKDIVLPPTIKTTSEAIKHLMGQYNLSQQDAIDLLRRMYR